MKNLLGNILVSDFFDKSIGTHIFSNSRIYIWKIFKIFLFIYRKLCFLTLSNWYMKSFLTNLQDLKIFSKAKKWYMKSFIRIFLGTKSLSMNIGFHYFFRCHRNCIYKKFSKTIFRDRIFNKFIGYHNFFLSLRFKIQNFY